jgi:hypothetical protein
MIIVLIIIILRTRIRTTSECSDPHLSIERVLTDHDFASSGVYDEHGAAGVHYAIGDLAVDAFICIRGSHSHDNGA